MAAFGPFDEALAKHAAMVARFARRQAALAENALRPKAVEQIQHDNIATPGAPVWRRRFRKPFTCWAVRIELVRQAGELKDEGERQLYVRRRLTELDKALSDDQAEALERWLDCEEMLQGRVKIGDYGDRTGGGSGQVSPVPDRVLDALAAHAEAKRRMHPYPRKVLAMLVAMMEAPQWDYAAAGQCLGSRAAPHYVAKKRFIGAVREAAAFLVKRERKVKR